MSYPLAPRYSDEIRIQGLRLSRVSMNDVHEFMKKTVRDGQKALVMNLNIHFVNLTHDEPWLKDFLNEEAQMIFCDSDGVRWGLRILGINPPPKFTMARWVWPFTEYCEKNDISLYLLGSKPGIAELAEKKMKEHSPNIKIAGTHHGYFPLEGPENEALVQEINRLKPDVLMVGLGMPLQEKWLKANWKRLDCHLFFNLGAVLDYTSGVLKGAPIWMVKLHLEWLYRLYQQPGRLFKRYVIGNPLFMLRVLKERFCKTDR